MGPTGSTVRLKVNYIELHVSLGVSDIDPCEIPGEDLYNPS